MKNLIAFALALLCTSCVTSGDLQRVTDSVAQLETVLDDPLATQEDVAVAIEAAKVEITAVKEEVEERTEDSLSTLESGSLSGIITAIAIMGLNMYRTSTRRKALDVVAAKEVL